MILNELEVHVVVRHVVSVAHIDNKRPVNVPPGVALGPGVTLVAHAPLGLCLFLQNVKEPLQQFTFAKQVA